MNTKILINVLKEWAKFFLGVGGFSLLAVSLMLAPAIFWGPFDETWSLILSVLEVSLFAFAIYYLIHIKFKREVRSSLETMCEPFSNMDYKLELALLLYKKQPTQKKLETIKAQYRFYEVDTKIQYKDDESLERATRTVRRLNSLSKVAIVDDLFKLALDESVISDGEWEFLQTVMTKIELDEAVKEQYNKKYSSYRAVFVNPFEKQKSTEIVSTSRVQPNTDNTLPESKNTLPENKKTLPGKQKTNSSKKKRKGGRRSSR